MCARPSPGSGCGGNDCFLGGGQGSRDLNTWEGTAAASSPGLVTPGVSQGRVKTVPCSPQKIY